MVAFCRSGSFGYRDYGGGFFKGWELWWSGRTKQVVRAALVGPHEHMFSTPWPGCHQVPELPSFAATQLGYTASSV